MQIVIEPTSNIVLIEGVPCRQWEGVTDNGVPCSVFTRLILVPREEAQTEFKDTPLEHLPKTPRMSNGNLQPGVESQKSVSGGLM